MEPPQLRKVSHGVEVVSQRRENQPPNGEGKTERLIETMGVSQEALKTSISLRNLDVSDVLQSLQHLFWDGLSGMGQDLTS